jgi:hypothetical protein
VLEQGQESVVALESVGQESAPAVAPSVAVAAAPSEVEAGGKELQQWEQGRLVQREQRM